MNLLFKLNIAVVILTVIAYVSAHIPPGRFWYLGFFAYGIPVFVVMNFIFLLTWIIKGSMRLLLSLITIIAGLGNIQATYSLATVPKPVNNQFSLMSYNVNCFNPYPREGVKDKQTFREITDYLLEDGPGILCLQEYCSYPTIKTFDAQSKLLEGHYKHLFYKSRGTDKNFETAGLATFSSYPMIKSGTVKNRKSETMAIYTDLLVFKDTIRVYNTHLYSMGLIDGRKQGDQGTIKGFIGKMKTGFEAKSLEAVYLINHMKQSPYKSILAGDFNEVPYSYIYKLFTAHFNNSFEIAGNGFGITYNGKIPFLRIDHQYADKKIKILRHRVVERMNATDHFPVVVDYTLE